MKKQVLALAITAATSMSAFAEADVYGSLRIKLTTGDSTTDISNDVSRIGLKGSVDTDLDGVTALYRFEAGVGSDAAKGASQNEAGLSSRLAYVGLTSEEMGTVMVGQIWTNYYSMVTGATDVTTNTSGWQSPFFRADSAFAYVSPEMGGLTVAAAVTSDADQTTDGEGEAERYMLTGSYAAGPLTVALGLTEQAAETAEDYIGLSVAYSADALYLAALVQQVETDVDGAESSTPFELAATYALSDADSIAAAYHDDDDDMTTGYTVEYSHAMGDATTVYATIATEMVDGGDDTTDFGLGLKVGF